MGVHIIQVMDDHFSIESHGFGDPSCQETTTCIYGHPPTAQLYFGLYFDESATVYSSTINFSLTLYVMVNIFGNQLYRTIYPVIEILIGGAFGHSFAAELDRFAAWLTRIFGVNFDPFWQLQYSTSWRADS